MVAPIQKESHFAEVPIEQDVDLVPLVRRVLLVEVVDPVDFELLIVPHAKEHGVLQS